MSIVIALIFAGYIIFGEYLRVRRLFYLDSLRMTSITFFLAYIYVPLLFFTGGVELNERFYWVDWIDYDDNALSSLALLIAVLGYVSIRAGFMLGKSSPLVRRIAALSAFYLRTYSFSAWLVVGVATIALSFILFMLYVMRRGSSVPALLQAAGQLRVGEYVPGIEDASFTFLTYATVGISGFFILLGLFSECKGASAKRKGDRCGRRSLWFLGVLVATSFVLSVVILWMRAGRLHLMNFFLVVLIFALGQIASKSGKFLVMVSAVAISGVIFAYGKVFFGVAEQVEVSFLSIPSLVALEVSFPFLSLVSALHSEIEYRWFIDVILSLVYFFVVPVCVIITGTPCGSLPVSVAKVNTLQILGTTDLGEIPVDLVTFGYFSGGVLGVVVTGMGFGFILAAFERLFSENRSAVSVVFRYAWMVFLSTVGLLYSDPVNVVRDGLYLWVPSLAVLTVGFLVAKGSFTRRKC